MPIASIVTLAYNFIYCALAYIIPGYLTFKAIEKKGSGDVKDWAEYWVVLSTLYVSQWIIDFVLCWLPFYYLAKLGFILALWHPNMRFAQYLYQKILSPLAVTYEADIDRMQADMRVKTADLLGQHAATLKVQMRKASGQAGVLIKSIQQRALEKAKQARGPIADATAGHGLHAE